MNIEILMFKYRSEGSKIYSGRPLGIQVRKDLDLNEKDQDGNTYTIKFPLDTVSINSSYFGGLFEKSVINLGREKFLSKYIFRDINGNELKDSLKENIEEGINDSLKEY